MSLGQSDEQQLEFWLAADELPEAPGSPFYRKLNAVLAKAGFDRELGALCEPYYAAGGRPSIPPGRYFRMLLVGYFEGIASQRGIAFRCADSLSLREFLGCPLNAEKKSDRKTPDHSSMTRIRDRLPLAVFEQAFVLIVKIASERGILKGKTLLVDSTLLEANASMKGIVRKVSRESWNEYILRLAEAEGIENPTLELAREADRKRQGKKTSNKDWESPVDPDARIAKMKDGRTHLAYKAEHAVDLDSGLIVSAGIEHADGGAASDSETVKSRVLEAAAQVLAGHEQVIEEAICDNGYHSAGTLHWFEQWGLRSYIAEKRREKRRAWTDKPEGQQQAYYANKRRAWTDKPEGQQQAYYANKRRVKGERGKALQRQRGEKVERSFAHSCVTGGGRRMWLRGLDKARKRWCGQTIAFNLGTILRTLTGVGTPRSLQGGNVPKSAIEQLQQALAGQTPGQHSLAIGLFAAIFRPLRRISAIRSVFPEPGRLPAVIHEKTLPPILSAAA